MDQLDIIDIYGAFHPKTMNFTFFFLKSKGTFFRIDHILGHKSSLHNYKNMKLFKAHFQIKIQ